MTHTKVRRDDTAGLIAGVFGCLLALLGIFTFGLLFIPLAAICALSGFFRGIAGGSGVGIGTSLLAGVLCVIGFIVSPSLWILAAALFVRLPSSQSNPAYTPAQPPAAVAVAPPQAAEALVTKDNETAATSEQSPRSSPDVSAAQVVPAAPAPTLYRVLDSTFGCSSPDTTRRLEGYPQPISPYYLTQQGCAVVTPASRWAAVSLNGDIALMDYRGTDGRVARFYIPTNTLYDDVGRHPRSLDTAPSRPPDFPAPVPNSTPRQANSGSDGSEPQSGPFSSGLKDRASWEGWVSGLQGDYRDGVLYWAANRSVRGALPCSRADTGRSQAWLSGCQEAAQRLAASDAERKSDPVYRAGWNSWTAEP